MATANTEAEGEAKKKNRRELSLKSTVAFLRGHCSNPGVLREAEVRLPRGPFLMGTTKNTQGRRRDIDS